MLKKLKLLGTLWSLLLVMITCSALDAQEHFSISFYKHSVSMPGGGFKGPFHPGFDIGWVHPLQDKNKWNSFVSIKTGFYYHRLVHSAIPVTAEYNINYKVTDIWWTGLTASAGYIHTFENHDIFKADANGNYTSTAAAGKAHGTGSLALNIRYAGKKLPFSPYLQYRFNIMTPFVKTYVPLLPSCSLHAGIYFSIDNKSAKNR